MVETPPSQAFRDSGAVAAYVEALTGELSRIAREHGRPTLAYILDMARLEARNTLLLEQEGEDEGSQRT